MRKAIIAITVLLLPILVGATIVFNPPAYELQGVESQSILNTVKYDYRIESLAATDESRATPAMGDFEGVERRTFDGKIWVPDVKPEDLSQGFPLVIYSHGFMSFHEESDYLGEFLAKRGYVMVSFDYPASNFNAPGGPNLSDITSQPGDISFVIDYLIARNEDPSDNLYKHINADNIATAGLSFGGLTTMLVAYHKELRDDRVDAAISIAGPTSFFNKSYFDEPDIPLLYIAGSIDAMVSYDSNAGTLKGKKNDVTIVTIANGSHTGFADISEKIFRWNNNPDDVGCSFLLDHIPKEINNPFSVLGETDVGINFNNANNLPCQNMPLPASIAPGEQLVLTKMAVYSFLEAHFSNPKEALSYKKFLTSTFALENSSVNVK